MELAYTILNASVIPFWILLAFFASKPITQKLLFTYRVHLALAVFYTVFIIWGTVENFSGEGGMGSLADLRIAFLNDKVLLAAWAHYLVFDLFVGTWIARKCLEENIPNALKWPSLALTLFFGPIGFLLFTMLKKKTKVEETV